MFQAGTQRRSVPNFQLAVQLAHGGKLGKLHTLFASIYYLQIRTQWLPGEPTPNRDVCDWNLWLGRAPGGSTTRSTSRAIGVATGTLIPAPNCSTGRCHTLDLCQWANQADNTMPIEYEPSETNITCRYANGVKVVFDFLKEPFGNRDPHYITRLGTCPVRFVGDAGSVETGDERRNR